MYDAHTVNTSNIQAGMTSSIYIYNLWIKLSQMDKFIPYISVYVSVILLIL